MGFCAMPFALAREVQMAQAPPGMIRISGGEFLMGATTSGHGSAEMPMQSNDAAPMRPALDRERSLIDPIGR